MNLPFHGVVEMNLPWSVRFLECVYCVLSRLASAAPKSVIVENYE